MLFNQWTGTGRLGKDPDMSYTPGGKAVTKFSIAVDQGKDQPAMWLNIICWEKLAERTNEQFRKGVEVLVQGRLAVRPYKDKNNIERQSLEVTASSAQLTQKPQQAVTHADAGADTLGDPYEHPF